MYYDEDSWQVLRFYVSGRVVILSLAGKRIIGFFIAMVLWKWIKYDGDTIVGSTYIPLIY